ncbi:MAG: response regulator transcription factor [Desulfobacula sp.]|jgi:DNA-binding NarL/FixJ family response regulator|uniref:response regulator transcription factor n=1 Tax=Desulfobacula sp. TaxID=2593537 RepID=UPI001DD59669|nr:response regulator transcription factor [Desulfobacula sp.]MBT3484163.1 response regulator transcription factor [Desulfobacula sp.]MBT3803724.1 response regulator transcription factor [Desulfobacula sp.]MBT4024429.1 response regulator transcription factor [Desulfobacula sp.]MBT4198470.1 response regulator transcription factor [Desulfobacula sp.]
MKKKLIEIVIADDHTIVRQGLRKLLEEEDYLKITGEAMNGREAVRIVRKLKPQIVIMDIAMPVLNGIEAARQIKQSTLKTKVIILSMHDHTRYIRELLSIGVSGYLLKNAVSNDIIKAINAAVKGETFLSPSISNRVIEDYVGMNQKTFQDELYNTLTNREREVFQMMVEGFTTKKISEILCLSPSTIKSHRSNIMEKLQMENISKLIQYAIHLGIIDIQM